MENLARVWRFVVVLLVLTVDHHHDVRNNNISLCYNVRICLFYMPVKYVVKESSWLTLVTNFSVAWWQDMATRKQQLHA